MRCMCGSQALHVFDLKVFAHVPGGDCQVRRSAARRTAAEPASAVREFEMQLYFDSAVMMLDTRCDMAQPRRKSLLCTATLVAATKHKTAW